MNRRLAISASVLCAIFVAGSLAGWMLCRHIDILAFDNPYNIRSLAADLQYNMSNNILRFAVLLLTPLAFLAATLLFGGRNLRRILLLREYDDPAQQAPPGLAVSQNWPVLLLVVALTVLYAINLPTMFIGQRKSLDHLHEGNQLGYAMYLMEDAGTPYEDFNMARGIGYDGMNVEVAFSLFEKSISGYRSFEAAQKIAVNLLFTVLVFVVFRKNVVKATVALLVLFLLGIVDRNAYMRVTNKEIFVMLVLLAHFMLQIALARERPRRVLAYVLAGLYSFFAWASLSYSTEKAFLLIAFFLLFCPTIYVLYIRKRGMSLGYWGSVLTGFGLAVLLLRAMGLEFDLFVDYYRETLTYVSLWAGKPFPNTELILLDYVLVLLFVTFYLFWFFLHRMATSEKNLAHEISYFLRNHFTEISLLIISLLLWRYALNDSHRWLVSYIIYTTYLLALYIILTHFLRGVYMARLKAWLCYGATGIVAVVLVVHIHQRDFLSKNFPFHLSDKDYFSGEFLEAAEFLKLHLEGEQKFFSFSNEASWYYLLGQASPTFEAQPWRAQPDFLQRRMVRDLKENNVAYVIMPTDVFYDAGFHGISQRERLYLVAEFLDEAFRPCRKFGKYRIWARKNLSAAEAGCEPVD